MAANFKIRNRYKEVLGTFTVDEIVRDIAGQKLSGDEEVAKAPYDQWVAISAQPEFFDAFLKRLFTSEYRAPDGGQRRGKTKAVAISDEKPTRMGGNTRAQGKTRVHGKTRVGRPEGADGPPADATSARRGNQTTAEPGGDPAATFQQANVDELFRDTVFSRENPMPGTGGGRNGAADGALLPLPEPLDTAQGFTEEESPSLWFKLKRAERRKLWLAGGVGILLGVFVLTFSGGNRVPALEEDRDAWIHQGDASATPAEMVATLSDEADSLARADAPLFYEAAVKVLREALALQPDNIDTLTRFAHIATLYLSDAREPEALIAEIRGVIRKGRKQDPQISGFYRAEGRIALVAGDFDAAKESVIHAAETDPNHPETYQLMAEIYLLGKEYDQAKSALLETVKAQPTNVRSHAWLAKTYLALGDPPHAAGEAFEAIKLNPLHAPSYLTLGEAFVASGSGEQATGFLSTVGKLARFSDPKATARAYELLADAQLTLGKKKDATESFQLAYYYSSGRVPAKLRAKFPGADLGAKALRRLAKDSEYPADYFQEQGEGLMGQGKLGEAMLFFQASQLLKPESGQALIRLGEITEKTATSYEDYRKVMILYQRAVEKAPKDPLAFVRLGILETDQYAFEHAQRLLERARELAPKDPNVLVALAKHFFKRQDYKQAAKFLLEAERIDRGISENQLLQGKILLLLGKNAGQNAMPFFYRAYELDDQNYEALAEWLKLKVAAMEKTFAIKFVRNLLDVQPKNAQLLWVLGEVYGAAKEHRRAITYYHAALDIDNRASKVRMSLAKSLESVGEIEKAVAEYRLASMLDRRNSDGFYRAADLYLQGKVINEAETIIKTLLDVTPRYPGGHRLYSKILQAKRNPEGAIEEMKKEVANNPENYDFALELSELYLTYQRYDAALKELTKVAQLPPVTKAPEFKLQKTRAYLLLSRTYLATGKFETAESPIKLALEIDPNDPELHKQLGDVYFALQRDKEGVKAYEFYLRANPAAFDAEAIRERIEKMRIDE